MLGDGRWRSLSLHLSDGQAGRHPTGLQHRLGHGGQWGREVGSKGIVEANDGDVLGRSQPALV